MIYQNNLRTYKLPISKWFQLMPNGATGQISKSSTVTVTVNPVHQDLEHPKSPLNPWNTQYTKQKYAGVFDLYISGDWEIAAKVSVFLELSWNHQHQNPHTQKNRAWKTQQTPTAVLSFSSISAATIRRTYCKAIHIASSRLEGTPKRAFWTDWTASKTLLVDQSPKERPQTKCEGTVVHQSKVTFRNKKTEGINISE